MIDVARLKEGGFIEYKHMLYNRASLMDCLDLLQAFYNMTSGKRLIYAKDSEDEILQLEITNKPVYEYLSLSTCSVFSICGWSRDEHCMFIMTLELGWRRVFLYSEEDIESEKLFATILHKASVLRERRRILMKAAEGSEDLLKEARWCGLDSNTARRAIGMYDKDLSLRSNYKYLI